MYNRGIPFITKNLLIINALVFLAQLTFSPWFNETFSAYYPLSGNFQPWQILTHMFMHGDLMHILFNMYALWMFGAWVENQLGQKKFLILYFAAGLGSFFLHNLVNYIEVIQLVEHYQLTDKVLNEIGSLPPGKYYPDGGYLEQISLTYNIPMMGASGAIFGVLVAFGMLFPDATLMLLFPPVPIKAKYLIPIFIVLELVFIVSNAPNDNIAHYAHLGGAIVGFFLVRYWKKNKHRVN